MNAEEAHHIGQRVRMIRRRRGLSLEVVAGLTGHRKSYLSMLERGQRGFNRRGLLEDLADALGCSVMDLTGQPYTPPDRESGRAKHIIGEIEYGLNEATLDDVPDMPAQPLGPLRDWISATAALRDTAQYRPSGEGIGAALVDLQIHIALNSGHARREAAGLLVHTAYHAFVLATTFGYLHLAHTAAQRATAAARIAERPELAAFAMFAHAPSVARTGGRGRAARMLDRAIADADELTTIRGQDTVGAETVGLLNLMSAHLAARNQDTDTAQARLAEAQHLAALTGERDGFGQHFGPTNVRLWRVAIDVELGLGPLTAEQLVREPLNLDPLGTSNDRRAALEFDLARCWAQADGARDADAIRHLDSADRLAPTRLRNDPLARNLVATLDRRARHQNWELDSLRNRFSINRAI